MSHKCSFCGSSIEEVLNYGEVALAGAFLKPDEFANEKKYPLSLCFCPTCYAVQIPERIDKKILFTDYFYHSSSIGTMKKHFHALAQHIAEFKPEKVIEIGCNDGVLLKPLTELGINAIGVDPSKVSGDTMLVNVVNDFWSMDVAKAIGKADMIVANNVFAHIDDIKEATRAIEFALTENGTFMFEVNRLDSLISDLQYDWVYHEHLYYYSLMSLEKHFSNYGLMVFDCKRLPTHAGSMRYYVCKGKKEQSKAVLKQRDVEKWMGLDKIDRFDRFARDAMAHRRDMQHLVSTMKSKGRVAGYGACGRANTMLQFCNIEVDYIVDDAPAKHGFYTPGTHIPIVSRSELSPDDPVIVFAWSFLQEIQAKVKNELYIPLPHIYQQKAA